jgi:hypothetical protein
MPNELELIEATTSSILEKVRNYLFTDDECLLAKQISGQLTNLVGQIRHIDGDRLERNNHPKPLNTPVASEAPQPVTALHSKIRLNLGNISPIDQGVPMPLPQPKIPAPQVALRPEWQQFDKGQEYLIELKQWFYEKEREQHPDTSPPTKILQGYVLGESEKAILFGGHCATVPAVICYACHHPLMDSVSQKLGIGPICRGRLREAYSKEFRDIADEEKRARAEIESIEWKGWLPKSQLESYKEVTS